MKAPARVPKLKELRERIGKRLGSYERTDDPTTRLRLFDAVRQALESTHTTIDH